MSMLSHITVLWEKTHKMHYEFRANCREHILGSALGSWLLSQGIQLEKKFNMVLLYNHTPHPHSLVFWKASTWTAFYYCYIISKFNHIHLLKSESWDNKGKTSIFSEVLKISVNYCYSSTIYFSINNSKNTL